MGIEVAGDPFWFDHLDRERRRAILGLFLVESEDAATEPPKPRNDAPPSVVVPAHANEHGTPEAYGRLADILASES